MYELKDKMYKSIQYKDNNQHVWYNHYGGYIIKSWIDKDSNRIMQEKIPYNQPNNYLKLLDNYFKYRLN